MSFGAMEQLGNAPLISDKYYLLLKARCFLIINILRVLEATGYKTTVAAEDTETFKLIQEILIVPKRRETEVIMAQLSQEEIRIAAEAVSAVYYKDGYDAGRKKADALQARMIEHGNTDSDSIYTFEKYSNMTYRR